MERKRVAVSLLLIGLTLATGPGTALAGGPIGWSSNISQQVVDAVSPAVAYNPDREEYLVVWYNDRAGNDDIQARRFSRDGTPIGNPFYIAAGAGAERRYPDVAYNSAEEEYLVVWENYDTTNGYTIYGARVYSTGGVIGNPFSIFSSDLSQQPAVAYASTANQYLVVWSWATTTGTHIMGRGLPPGRLRPAVGKSHLPAAGGAESLERGATRFQSAWHLTQSD